MVHSEPLLKSCANVTSSSLLSHFLQLLSPLFYIFVPSHVSHLICCCFPPPTPSLLHPPLRPASCGTILAPARTSARHEAVRVWLESVSGGSADLKGTEASRLGLQQPGAFFSSCALASMLAARPPPPSRMSGSPVWSHLLTFSKVLNPKSASASTVEQAGGGADFEQTGINGLGVPAREQL